MNTLFNPRQNANANDIRRWRLNGEHNTVLPYDQNVPLRDVWPVSANQGGSSMKNPGYSPFPLRMRTDEQLIRFPGDSEGTERVQGIPAYIYPVEGFQLDKFWAKATHSGEKVRKHGKHHENRRHTRGVRQRRPHKERRPSKSRRAELHSDSSSSASEHFYNRRNHHLRESGPPISQQDSRLSYSAQGNPDFVEEKVTTFELQKVPVKKLIEEVAYKTVQQPCKVTVPQEKTRMKEVWIKKTVPEKYIVNEVQEVMKDVRVPTKVTREVEVFEEVEVPVTRIVQRPAGPTLTNKGKTHDGVPWLEESNRWASRIPPKMQHVSDPRIQAESWPAGHQSNPSDPLRQESSKSNVEEVYSHVTYRRGRASDPSVGHFNANEKQQLQLHFTDVNSGDHRKYWTTT
eukprot:NODE_1995_length_1332_cov_24.145752_g1811_i0.p1 GENE.NODE_1995_length_1332_cov_24.145752_g1811_i0~~NODE_1995_length_1332_cov_24.145752_g1811_i0.p1  ORF type:complete len:401 (+),score=47.42 NODE_1995_length_1332_cov_24.145752_g1811_i0:39-1241(+)